MASSGDGIASRRQWRWHSRPTMESANEYLIEGSSAGPLLLAMPSVILVMLIAIYPILLPFTPV